MIYKKKESVGAFLRKGEDIKNGDIVTIMDEGKKTEGEYGTQDIFEIKTKDGKDGNVSFNQTTINNLIDGYGEDSAKWIGKKVKVEVVRQSVAGKLMNVYYFLHPDSEFDDKSGKFIIPKERPPVIPKNELSKPEGDLPF